MEVEGVAHRAMLAPGRSTRRRNCRGYCVSWRRGDRIGGAGRLGAMRSKTGAFVDLFALRRMRQLEGLGNAVGRSTLGNRPL